MSTDAPATNRLDVERIEALIDARFPQIHAGGRSSRDRGGGRAQRARAPASTMNATSRPGGTVSGPAMFTLADFAIYVAIIAALGEPGLDAVTTNLNINFLPSPSRATWSPDAPHPLGRRLAVGEVELVFGRRGRNGRPRHRHLRAAGQVR